MSREFGQFVAHLEKKCRNQRVPLIGHLELTYRCNFRCIHCYQSGVEVANELETHEWISIMDQTAAAGCLWLTISGGDPLVRRDFAGLYVHAIRSGFLVTLFTNGALVTDEVAELIATWPPQWVEVTIYGATAETYKEVTGVAVGYERALAGIERLQSRGVPVQLKTVALTKTLPELGAMERYAAERAAPFRFESVIHPTLLGDRATTRFRPSPKQVVALDQERPHRLAKLPVLAKDAQSDVIEPVYTCGAGHRYFSVDPAGRMHVCPAVYDPSWSLREMSFSAAWRAAQGEVSRSLTGSPCSGCEVKDLCPRCAALSQMETGDVAGWSPYFGEIANRRASLVGRQPAARCIGEAFERRHPS